LCEEDAEERFIEGSVQVQVRPLGGHTRAGKSFFDQVCEQLPVRKIVRLRHDKESLWSVDLENEEGVDMSGPGRETFAKVCAEVMMPQLPLFVPPPNDSATMGGARTC
jgi:hypothetical protein